jgi:hypothetical protein
LIIVILLKFLIDDHSCNIHPNSVSGHYNLIIFATLGLLYLYFKDEEKPYSTYFWICFFVFKVSGWLMLYQTLFLGYHSIRQVVYGSLFAISWFILHTLFVEKDYASALLIGLSVFGSFVLLIYMSHTKVIFTMIPTFLSHLFVSLVKKQIKPL